MAQGWAFVLVIDITAGRCLLQLSVEIDKFRNDIAEIVFNFVFKSTVANISVLEYLAG
jgi:hypothetical protein